MTTDEKTTALERDLADVINHHCAESDSNTPDYILAWYLRACLVAFAEATRARESWYGVKFEPGKVTPCPLPPPGYAACTRSPGHDGPCALPRDGEPARCNGRPGHRARCRLEAGHSGPCIYTWATLDKVTP